MELQRVAPVLHDVAQIRHWLAAQMPEAGTLLGYDLLMHLADEAVVGRPVTVAGVAAALGKPAADVHRLLAQFADDGWLTPISVPDHASGWQPTARLTALLEAYGEQVERVFIVRADLRGRQLHVAVGDPLLAADIARWYDRVYDLGWLYLHYFGGACFLMASLVQRIAAHEGYAARVLSCQVEVSGPDVRYLLGAPGGAKPGEVDGHAVCLIDERVLVDFGLGNIRRNFRRDFVWGVAVECVRNGVEVAGLEVPSGHRIAWKDDWQSPAGARELERYAPHLDRLLADYLHRPA